MTQSQCCPLKVWYSLSPKIRYRKRLQCGLRCTCFSLVQIFTRLSDFGVEIDNILAEELVPGLTCSMEWSASFSVTNRFSYSIKIALVSSPASESMRCRMEGACFSRVMPLSNIKEVCSNGDKQPNDLKIFPVLFSSMPSSRFLVQFCWLVWSWMLEAQFFVMFSKDSSRFLSLSQVAIFHSFLPHIFLKRKHSLLVDQYRHLKRQFECSNGPADRFFKLPISYKRIRSKW